MVGKAGGSSSADGTGRDRPQDDPLLLALEDLVHAAAKVNEAVEMLTARAGRMRAMRLQGATWRDIVDAEERPLIAEMLTDTIQRFEAAGTRFRRAKARALHDEGMTMEQIADLFGLTRQRISALLRPSASLRGGDE
jgi:hypothetical protein